tara:strand:- start:665 stop:904 length:240 start_codon:yes stop_codon:yes gene_type:complete
MLTLRETRIEARSLPSSFDWALPSDWFDMALRVTGSNPHNHVVWSYDHAGIFGAPYALTPQGDEIVAQMNEHRKELTGE